MQTLQYPRPTPKPIIWAMFLWLGSMVLYAFITWQSIIHPNAHHSLLFSNGNIIAIFVTGQIYCTVLYIMGFYTGRRWVVNLCLIFAVFALLSSSWIFIKYGSHISHLFCDLLRLAALALFYIPESNKWFALCKAVRIKRKINKSKNIVKIWIITVTVIFLIASILGVVLITFNSTYKGTYPSKKLFIQNTTSKNNLNKVCKSFFKNDTPDIKKYLVQKNITSQNCVARLQPKYIECTQAYAEKIPQKINMTSGISWSMKILNCSLNNL